MYEFDVLILDVTSPKYYDRQTLEKSGLGGTEASVIRVAEGLAGFGLKVCIVESQPAYFEPTMGQYCFFFHSDDLGKLRCKHFIQLRGIGNSHLFPRAKKYVWLHDEASEKIKSWDETLINKNIKVIGVSRWHKKDIQKYLTTTNVEYIYNPVPDEIFVPSDLELKYDKNQMIWAASPHKGLEHALEVFKQVKARVPEMGLVVCNPGYMTLNHVDLMTIPGVTVYGALSCKQLWSLVQRSLCTFYPSTYNETFCCLLAESNAVGTPFLGYSRQVLNEVVSSEDQLVTEGDQNEVVERIVSWNTNGRPKVTGKNEFKLSNVIFKWIQLLSS